MASLERKYGFKLGGYSSTEIGDHRRQTAGQGHDQRFLWTVRTLALLALIVLTPTAALGKSDFSGTFFDSRCGNGRCAKLLQDGTRLIGRKFYSVFEISIYGREAWIGIITDGGKRNYVGYTYDCFLCLDVTPEKFLTTVEHWDSTRHRAAPYNRGDFLTAYYRGFLWVFSHPIGIAAFFLVAIVHFFLDRAGSETLGKNPFYAGQIIFGAIAVTCPLAADQLLVQDLQFGAVNAYLETRRASPAFFQPLDYLPEVQYAPEYYLPLVPFIILNIFIPIYIYFRWAVIVHGFYYYTTRDPNKKLIEAAVDRNLPLKGKIARPTQTRSLAKTAVMAASAHKLTEKLRADEAKHKAVTKLLECQTELLQAASERERARESRRFLESRGDDHA